MLQHHLCLCHTRGSAPLRHPEHIFGRHVESIEWAPLWKQMQSRQSMTFNILCLCLLYFLNLTQLEIDSPALSRLSAFVSIFFLISIIFIFCSAGLSFLISSVSYRCIEWKKQKRDQVMIKDKLMAGGVQENKWQYFTTSSPSRRFMSCSGLCCCPM